MFWNVSKANSAAAVLEPQPITKDSIAEVTPPNEIDYYGQISQRLGYENPEYVKHRLEAVILDLGLSIYPLDQVVAYMNDKANKLTNKRKNIKGRWGWWPLRTEDKAQLEAHSDWFRRLEPNEKFILDSPYPGGLEGNNTYWAAIPLPVLITANKILEQDQNVTFLVATLSTIRDPRLDPFLAVIKPGIRPIVVERWDEPAFRSGVNNNERVSNEDGTTGF